MAVQMLGARNLVAAAAGIGLCYLWAGGDSRRALVPSTPVHGAGDEQPVRDHGVAVGMRVRAPPIGARVALGCQPGEGFAARVVAQAGEHSASKFPFRNGFVAVYSDGSWIHIVEREQPCVVARGSRTDMSAYFAVE